MCGSDASSRCVELQHIRVVPWSLPIIRLARLALSRVLDALEQGLLLANGQFTPLQQQLGE